MKKQNKKLKKKKSAEKSKATYLLLFLSFFFEKIRKYKTYNNEEKPYLKKNEVCLLSPNFKLASK
jgi:hypothetical protein